MSIENTLTLEYARPSHLNLAGFYPVTSCLGPGKRCIIWLQGCLKRCPGCTNPDMQPLEDRMWIRIEELAVSVGTIQGIEGITLVGGEPMLQTEGVAKLFDILRREYGLTTMLYTGYTLDYLIKAPRKAFSKVLALTDILVDGPYIKELDNSQKWRGSENQIIHFLTSRYKDWQWVMNSKERDIEIHLDDKGNYLVLGIPSERLYERLP